MQRNLVIFVLCALCGMGQLLAMEATCKGPVRSSPVPHQEPTMLRRIPSSLALLAMMYAPGVYDEMKEKKKKQEKKMLKLEARVNAGHDGAPELKVLAKNLSSMSLDEQDKSPTVSCGTPTSPKKSDSWMHETACQSPTLPSDLRGAACKSPTSPTSPMSPIAFLNSGCGWMHEATGQSGR